MHPRWRYSILLLLTIFLGLAVRFASVWPRVVSKYGGSALWAIAIFWLVSLLVPYRTSTLRAGLALLLAFAIEFFKLVRTPALDAFRLTLPGKLVLGRIFSVRDLLAYSIAFLCAAAFDRAVLTRSHAAGHAVR